MGTRFPVAGERGIVRRPIEKGNNNNKKTKRNEKKTKKNDAGRTPAKPLLDRNDIIDRPAVPLAVSDLGRVETSRKMWAKSKRIPQAVPGLDHGGSAVQSFVDAKVWRRQRKRRHRTEEKRRRRLTDTGRFISLEGRIAGIDGSADGNTLGGPTKRHWTSHGRTDTRTDGRASTTSAGTRLALHAAPAVRVEPPSPTPIP